MAAGWKMVEVRTGFDWPSMRLPNNSDLRIQQSFNQHVCSGEFKHFRQNSWWIFFPATHFHVKKCNYSQSWSRVRKTLSARQQCWPESFCKSGKFLQQAHYWLKNFRIFWKMSGCYTKYPKNMQSVRRNWKVSAWSKKCRDEMCPDNLKMCLGDLDLL